MTLLIVVLVVIVIAILGCLIAIAGNYDTI